LDDVLAREGVQQQRVLEAEVDDFLHRER